MTQKSLLQSAGDGTAVPAGYVGETLRSLVSSETSWPVSTGVWGDFSSLTLTSGTWLINFTFHFSKFDATYGNSNRIDFVGVGVSTTSGNSTTNLTYGVNAAKFDNTLISGGTTGIPFYLSMVAVCDGTNIVLSGTSMSGTILRAKAMTSSIVSGTPKYSLKLEAIRIA
jgi:hypothetical protein